MSTGKQFAGFFPKRIVGSEVFETDIFDASRQETRDLAGEVIGELVIDDTNVGYTLSLAGLGAPNDKFTMGGDLSSQNAAGDIFDSVGGNASIIQVTEGSRTITLFSPTWFQDLPYRNAFGSSLLIFMGMAEFPTSVDNGSMGNRGYSRKVRAPGVSINPDSVADAGTHLRLTVLTGLTALGIPVWDTANEEDNNWSYDCVVWLDTDQSGVEIQTDDPDVAIALTAKLTKTVGSADWVVILDGIGDGYLGQSVPSTTASHYKIAVLGPIATNTDLRSTAQADDFIYIGAINAGPTTSTAGQRVATSVSQALLNTEAVAENLLDKGWINRNSFTSTAANVTITGAGKAYSSGKIIDTPSGAVLTPVGPSQSHYVYYSLSTQNFLVSTSAATALSSSNVPLLVFVTDGASNVVTGSVVYGFRKVELFNDSLYITVGSNANAMFEDLREAMFQAYMIQQSGSNRSTVIQVIGEVTVASEISDNALFTITDLHFRGCTGRRVSAQGAGGRITVTHTGSLFKLFSGSISSWSFNNIHFRYDAQGAAIQTALISTAVGTTGVGPISFRDCLVDGNQFLQAVGGANGYLPHLIYMNAGQLVSLEIRNCDLYLAESAVYLAGGITNGFTNVWIVDNTIDNGNETPTYSVGGALWDQSTAGSKPNNLIVKGNMCPGLSGPLVYATRMRRAFIHDNYVRMYYNAAAINISNTTAGEIREIFIHDNMLSMDAGLTTPLIAINAVDNSTTDPSVVIIHDNIIKGDQSSPLNIRAVSLGVGSTGSQTATMFHDNVVHGYRDGIRLINQNDLQLHSNVFIIDEAGIEVEAAGDFTQSMMLIHSNVIRTLGSNPIGIDFVTPGFHADARCIVSGNAINMVDSTGALGFGVWLSQDTSDGFMINNNMIWGDSAQSFIGITIDGSTYMVNNNMLVDCDFFADGDGTLTGATQKMISSNIFQDSDISIQDGDDVMFLGNFQDPHSASGGLSIATQSSQLDMVFVGNSVDTIDVSGRRMIMVGNNVRGAADFSPLLVELQETTIVGNSFASTINFGTGLECTFVGNFQDSFGAAIDFTGERWTINSNVLGSNVITLSGDHNTLVANTHQDPTIQDTGANNTVQHNNAF